MATITETSNAAPVRAAEKKPRPWWAAPVFILGGVALLIVAIWRPTLGNVEVRRLDRELAALRKLLSKPDGNLEEVVNGATHALETAPSIPPDREAELYLLRGSARAYRADKATADEAAVYWREARADLEKAEQLGVSEADKVRLRYRLAKVAAHTGETPTHVVDQLKPLEAVLDDARDRADYYRVLVEAYLAQTPPSLLAALEANDKLRGSQASEDVLVEARVRSAELKLRLDRAPGDVRKDLDMVPRDAPLALRNKALVLRGRTYQQEKNWPRAAEAWTEVLKDDPALPDREKLQYLLGECQRQLNQPALAIKAWEECVRVGTGDEVAAASLGLAELALSGPEPDKVLEYLQRVLNHVQTPGDWHNSFVSLASVKERIERIARDLRQAARYELAARVAEPYSRLAPGPSTVLVAESTLGWARQCQEQARQQQDPVKRQAEERTTRDLFHRAAEAFARAADLDFASSEKALWQAAACYLEAGDGDRQIEILTRYLPLATSKAREAETRFLIAETLNNKGDRAGCEKLYLDCLTLDENPYACRARYQLAQLRLAENKVDLAQEYLEQNQKKLRESSLSDPATQEKTSYALGKIYIEAQKYYAASQEFVKLSGVQDDPTNKTPAGPDGVRARYYLAQSYRMMAENENQKARRDDQASAETKKNFLKDSQRLYYNAALEFMKLHRILHDQPALTTALPTDDVRHLPFFEAECFFASAHYDEALSIYESLIELHRGTEAGLDALGGTIRCHYNLRQGSQKEQRLSELREALRGMDQATQAKWKPWVDDVSNRRDLP